MTTPPNKFTDELREKLAAAEHARWSRWQAWVHKIGTRDDGGNIIIASELVRRWERQISIPYKGLSEPEKDSDRKEADETLAIVLTAFRELKAMQMEPVDSDSFGPAEQAGSNIGRRIRNALRAEILTELGEVNGR